MDTITAPEAAKAAAQTAPSDNTIPIEEIGRASCRERV